MEHVGRGVPHPHDGRSTARTLSTPGGCRPLTSCLHGGIYPPASPLTVRVITATPWARTQRMAKPAAAPSGNLPVQCW